MRIQKNKRSFVEGKKAYIENIPLKKNPYQFSTSEHMEWKLGWRESELSFESMRKLEVDHYKPWPLHLRLY